MASAEGNPEPSNVVPFMSHQSKVYLAGMEQDDFRCTSLEIDDGIARVDVHDHLEYVLASLETFETISENLIGYCFNVSSSSKFMSHTGAILMFLIWDERPSLTEQTRPCVVSPSQLSSFSL